MRTRRPLAALASLFLLAVAIPATALADETGSAGSVSKVDVNTPSADTYLQYHGRVIILTGKTTKTEYRWGGTSCGTKTVPADMVSTLVEASRNTDLVVTPLFQLGQGDLKCLVGFTVNKKR
jgi:hypothetical protein